MEDVLPVNLPSRQILWIEDDYYHISGLMRPLEKMGFKVTPARSVVEARGLLENWQKFCIVIVDLIIPYSDRATTMASVSVHDAENRLAANGIALLDFVVNDLKVAIPIIVMSVVNSKAIAQHLAELGISRRLEKLALLPQEVKRIVLEEIRDRYDGTHTGDRG